MSNENVTIERVVAGGDGMARLADGRVVFIGGTITARKIFFICRDLNVDPLAGNRAADKHNSPIG